MKTALRYCTIKALLLMMLTLAATEMTGQENAPYFCNKAKTTAHPILIRRTSGAPPLLHP